MALVTTPGANDADAYISIEEAEELLADNAGFLALSDSQKELLIKKATMQIDTLRFFGEKDSENQALQFPRFGERVDGELVIPAKVKYATAEQVAYIFSGEGQKRAQMQSDGVQAYSIGDVSETFNGKGAGYADIAIASQARGYLKGKISRVGRITNEIEDSTL